MLRPVTTLVIDRALLPLELKSVWHLKFCVWGFRVATAVHFKVVCRSTEKHMSSTYLKGAKKRRSAELRRGTEFGCPGTGASHAWFGFRVGLSTARTVYYLLSRSTRKYGIQVTHWV